MARGDIYSRIEEIIEEMRGDWKTFFMSDVMEEFARRYIANLIAGVYDSLRVEGAQIAPSLAETEMRKFIFEREYDPNSENQTAFCASTDKVFKICVNGAGAMVNRVSTVEEKFEVVVGMLIHEVGHRLFTDFPTSVAQLLQMTQFGRWFPRAPLNFATAEGIALSQKLANNEAYRATFADLMQHISDYLEDGYIEEELRSHYPGLASSYLGYVRQLAYEDAPTLTDLANKPEPSNLEMVLSQWLMYATCFQLKTGEKDIADFDPAVTEPIWSAMDIIDEARNTRSPQARVDAVNQLAVMISPLLDEEIDKQMQKQQNQQGQQGQNGQNGQQGQGQGGGNAAANNAVQQAINAIAQAMGSSGQPNGNTSGGGISGNSSKSITDPDKLSNSGLQPTVHKDGPKGTPGSGQNEKNKGGSGGLGAGEIDHSAAEHDLDSLFVDAAVSKARAEAEKERTKDMREEANQLDLSDSPCGAPSIERATDVTERNKAQYNKLAGRSAKIAKRLARLLTKQLKSEESEEYMAWQYSGRKFVAKQYCRDNLKGFAQKRLPSEKLRCRVYVLVDESGSVAGELSDAEVATSIVLEQFCSDMEVPLTIQGYTSGGPNGLSILSYVEEKKIDGQDKYRLTGMSARGGTPTVSAMAYALARIRKGPETKNTLLFVITDGQSGDDDSKGTRTRVLVNKAAKDGIRVIACGIGSDQTSVKRQFGEENFLGIDNLEEMPEKLVEIIRRKIMRGKR